jgi:hypothetical protein
MEFKFLQQSRKGVQLTLTFIGGGGVDPLQWWAWPIKDYLLSAGCQMKPTNSFENLFLKSSFQLS